MPERRQEQASSEQSPLTLRRGRGAGLALYRFSTNLFIGTLGAAGSAELFTGHTLSGEALFVAGLLVTAIDTASTTIINRRQQRLIEQQPQHHQPHDTTPQ